MNDVYIGHASRFTKEFRNSSGTLEDPTALSVSVRHEETGEYLATSAEGTFHDLNILANKVSTGIFFVKVTPDAAEETGIYLLYWRAAFGSGGATDTITIGPEVLHLHAEADIPALADNYLSLDGVAKAYPDLFDLETPPHILQAGYIASRDIDARLDERFDVPIRKKSDGTYDQPLVDAAVALTVGRILDRKGYPEEADRWLTTADKIVDDIKEGRRRLIEEITGDEIGFGVPKPASTNSTRNIELELAPQGTYTDVYRRKMIIQIDGAGAIGTATYKVSIDAGQTWETEAQTTKETWVYPDSCHGLGFRFFVLASGATLAVGDKWTFDAVPTTQKVSASPRGLRTAELRL